MKVAAGGFFGGFGKVHVGNNAVSVIDFAEILESPDKLSKGFGAHRWVSKPGLDSDVGSLAKLIDGFNEAFIQRNPMTQREASGTHRNAGNNGFSVILFHPFGRGFECFQFG